IYMDDQVISLPSVRVPILDGQAEISGNFTTESASELAQTINTGALPFALKATSSSTISPSLGQDSLKVMVISGIIALLLLSIYMLLYYRLTGFAACLSLYTQVAGILLAISIPQQTLTLQGIAGIILSIGMGVDANVIISERIKEELNAGDNLPTALSNGFTRAFSSVFDGNVTVAIAAAMLMFFGSGTTLSFGYSLLVGVIMNGITGVWMTRLMIGSLANNKYFQNPWLYGKRKTSNKPHKEPYDYCRHVRTFAVLSAVLILAGVVVSVIRGVNLDIDFRGGSIINYAYEGQIDPEEASSLLKTELNREVGAQTMVSRADSRTEISFNIAGNQSLTPEQLDQVTKALEQAYPGTDIKLSSSLLVDPLIGKEMLLNGLKAVLLASALIIIYIWFSFRSMSGPSAGFMALLALLHDILAVFFFIVLIGDAINETIIAVILTILGWSINDTIVVYDRIRENIRLTGGTIPLDELVNKSIRQSLSRSVNTSAATFLAVAVAFIFAQLYGLSSITEFALPMMFGIAAGTYSSLYLASPLWVRWKQRGGRTGYHAGANAVALLLALLTAISLINSPARSVLAAGEADISATAQIEESKLETEAADFEAEESTTTSAAENLDIQTDNAAEIIDYWPQLEDIKAKAYLVLNAATGEVIIDYNGYKRLPMASTTKILTALTVLNLPGFDPDRIVTVSPQATQLPSAVSARAGVVSGEQITTEECLYALMVQSANDCANVLAENYSPLQKGTALEKRNAFCAMATEFAHKLGAENTATTNPSGFTQGDHYSTAYDLALLSQEGLKNDFFHKLVTTSAYRMPANSKHPVAGWKILRNTNKLVLASPELYDSSYFKSYEGVKTGTTDLAGYCLVGAGTTHDDRLLIGVILGAELKYKGHPLGIDVLMRSLLEEGAEKLGVTPHGQDPGNYGRAYSGYQLAADDPDSPISTSHFTHPSVNTVTGQETVAESPDTESEPASTTVGSENMTTTNSELTKSSSGFSFSSLSWVLFFLLVVVLIVVLIFLGYSIRRDNKRRRRR
ncbi:MAG: protein translocase subunit SecF, partial [Clostridiales bacterium]|nr:protein translocase subunit SecF [Clostridiales bacterium]